LLFAFVVDASALKQYALFGQRELEL
jgi:hypothetical protein